MKVLLDRSFPAETSQLVAVRAAAAEACTQAGCGEECAGEMVLALNEAVMNIIQHGYERAPGQAFLLRIMCDGEMLVANLLDNARQASTADLRPRELTDLRPGGLGVRFMREVTDLVDYLPPPSGYTNCLQLLKRIY